jgi:hypothetical protein
MRLYIIMDMIYHVSDNMLLNIYVDMYSVFTQQMKLYALLIGPIRVLIWVFKETGRALNKE